MNSRVTMLSRLGLFALVGGVAACSAPVGQDGPIASENALASNAEAFTLSLVPGVYFDAASGLMTIFGTGGNDVASVALSGSNIVGALNLGKIGGQSMSVAAASVKKINFWGVDGADSFVNSTGVTCSAYGGAGNDSLTGGTASDLLSGDDGDDTIHGGDSRDTIFGGKGNDKIFGESGQDLIVTVGGGVDTITGGPQWDNVWMDSSDTFVDPSVDEQGLGYVHKISSFEPISYSGGNTWTPIGLEPSGGDLPDPLPDFSKTSATKNFGSNPLFASGGPDQDDVLQGNVGDCYFMSPLSANAGSNAEAIRKIVAPLGDGTFAVRFYDAASGAAQYYRVDADLWVDGAGAPIYAERGTESSIWVPIVEKAYAFFRRDDGTYNSIASGDGLLDEQLKAVSAAHPWLGSLTAQQMINWNNAGRPAGAVSTAVTQAAKDMLNWIAAQRAAGVPLLTGAISGVSDNTMFKVDDPATSGDESTWRRGQHIYMIDHVSFDAGGTPISVTLRNPYFGRFGQQTYVTLTDYAHIVYCLGGSEFKMP